MDIPYIFYIFQIYFLNLVCFLIYGVKSRSGHDRMTSFGSISHISGPKHIFWGIFFNDSARFFPKTTQSKSKTMFLKYLQMILHGFAPRNPKNINV